MDNSADCHHPLAQVSLAEFTSLLCGSSGPSAAKSAPKSGDFSNCRQKDSFKIVSCPSKFYHQKNQLLQNFAKIFSHSALLLQYSFPIHHTSQSPVFTIFLVTPPTSFCACSKTLARFLLRKIGARNVPNECVAL